MLKRILLWSAVPFFETLSQIFMNFASHSVVVQELGVAWFVQMAQAPWFWGSLVSDLCCFLCWMAILKQAKLSVAFPLSSMCFITVLLAGWGIFHEPLTLQHWLGTVCILSGIFLVSKEATA